MQSHLTFPSPKDHCPPTTKNRQLSENNAKKTMWLATAFQGVSAVVLCGVVAATWTCKYSSTEINIPPHPKAETARVSDVSRQRASLYVALCHCCWECVAWFRSPWCDVIAANTRTTKHVVEENEQCETDKQPYMCQVVHNAMGHLTLDVADAIIGRRRRGRGCHGVTMMATVSLSVERGVRREWCATRAVSELQKTKRGKRDMARVFQWFGMVKQAKKLPKTRVH